MESNTYELLLIAIPMGSDAQERLYESLARHNCLALGMQIDLENDTEEEELEKLMTTIMKEGCEHYGLQTE